MDKPTEYIWREDALNAFATPSRDDAISGYIESGDSELKAEYYADVLIALSKVSKETINAIPAADVVEVVRGEWKDRCVRDWVCSLCGCEIQKVRFYDGYRYTSLPDFCPDCGAVMTEAGLKKIAEVTASRDRTTDAAAELTMKVGELTDRAEQAERERDAAIKFIRTSDWCAGCENMKNLHCDFMKECANPHDLYKLRGMPQEGEGV